MNPENEWDLVRSDRTGRLGSAGMGLLRVTLLFGSAAAALALILAPIAEDATRPQVAETDTFVGLDQMSTGSTPRGGSAYILRKSVLQSSPNAVCIIRDDGTKSGDC